MYGMLLTLFFALTLILGAFLGRRAFAQRIAETAEFEHLGSVYSVVCIGRKDNPKNGLPEALRDPTSKPPFADGVLGKVKLLTAQDREQLARVDNDNKRKEQKSKCSKEQIIIDGVSRPFFDFSNEHFDCVKCCRDAGVVQSRMILCSECGNKRCPKALNHVLACTRSNEVDQLFT